VTRVWQHRDGSLSLSSGWANAAGWTEVQVVPLDAIVIEPHDGFNAERAEAFVRQMLNVPADAALSKFDVDRAAARAADLAVAARYLREHPPVDEAQVAALAAMLPNDGGDLARRIIATGRVQVTP
jgi:hypothetical protein